MVDIMKLAREAYRAYGLTTDFKNYRGDPMPEWDHLPANIQEAWYAAVSSVVTSLLPPEDA